MRASTNDLSISIVRADALFASALQPSDDPSAARIAHAIARAVREFGARGCAARVAQAYGDQPETAAARMHWARAMAIRAFDESRAEPADRRASGKHSALGVCRAA